MIVSKLVYFTYLRDLQSQPTYIGVIISSIDPKYQQDIPVLFTKNAKKATTPEREKKPFWDNLQPLMQAGARNVSFHPSKNEWDLTNGPRSVSYDGAIRYSVFFGVREFSGSVRW